MTIKINTLCVFCGSSMGARSEYASTATTLAQAMVERNIDLVYGGASIGIMGTVADAILAAGGKAYGVIPQHLQSHEIDHKGLTELHIVADMHERKALMAELSDGFIALPGGIGTLEELIEICTWQQLALHSKPCGMLNVAGYYQHLNNFLDHCEQEQFLRREHRNNILCADTAPALLNAIQLFANQEHQPTLKIPGRDN